MGSLENLSDLLSGTKRRFATMKLAKFLSRVKPPLWMRRSDGLMGLYHEQQMLLRKGSIVIGVIVQVNKLLFEHDRSDCPACVLYSIHPYFQTEKGISELHQIALRVYSLKEGVRDDSEETAIGESLADEAGRYFKIRLPYHLTNGREVFMTAIMVHRQLLPLPFLRSGWFPLIVYPKKSKFALICPAVFWDKELVRLWSMDPEEWI